MTKTSTDLVRVQLEESLELTSLKALAREAETVMLLADTSGSMAAFITQDDPAADPKTAIQVVREVIATVRGNNELPIIAFGGPYDCEVRFVDVIPEPDGGTPLHAAITLAKQYGATRLVVISDGCPDLRDQSMENARAFGGQIDVVFIGREGDAGSRFLEALASATGGKRLQGDLRDTKQLTSTVIGLLDGDVEEKPILQGEGFTSVEPDENDEDDCPTCDMPDGEHAEDCPNREDDEEEEEEDDDEEENDDDQ